MTHDDFSAVLRDFDAYPVGQPQPQGSDFDAACEALESLIGNELSDELRDFLRICGGHSWHQPFTFPIGDGSRSRIQATLTFGDGAYNVIACAGLMGDRLPQGCVPLALDAGGNFVCQDTDGGAILFWDHENAPEGASVSDLIDVAEDLGAWLESWEAEED